METCECVNCGKLHGNVGQPGGKHPGYCSEACRDKYIEPPPRCSICANEPALDDGRCQFCFAPDGSENK